MKRLIILIMILSSLGYSQELIVILDSDYNNRETKELLASLTTPISKSYATTLDRFISMVKDSLAIANLSDAFDVMYDLGGETTEQSLKNLVKRQHDATAVNSPTWTQWEGFTGDGTTSYLNTNYNDSLHATARTLTSSTYGIYIRSFGNVTNQGHIGSYRTDYYGTSTWLLGLDITMYYDNVGTGANITYTNAETKTLVGLWVTSRTNSTTATLYANSTQKAQSTTHSSAIRFVNLKNYIMARYFGNNDVPINYSNSQYSFAFIGRGLSATEVRKLTNCVEWLMDSKGKGVIP